MKYPTVLEHESPPILWIDIAEDICIEHDFEDDCINYEFRFENYQVYVECDIKGNLRDIHICVDRDTPIGNYNFSVFKDF